MRTRRAVGGRLPEPTAKRAHTSIPARDRLSALPDALLHTIQSALPARQLVQTTLLSRRWRDLWCSVPCISIDEAEFDIGTGRDVAPTKWSRFESFTTNLLLFHSNAVSLERFRIHAHRPNRTDVDKWVRLGIKYCPAALDVSIVNSDLTLKLPPLGSCASGISRLHLCNVTLDGRFAENLASGCPVLETLELKNCRNYFQNITSSSLKDLLLDSCLHFDAQPVVITAPGLTSLYLDIADPCYRYGISVHEAASLAKASVCIRSDKFLPEKNQRSLLASMFSVASLELVGFDTTVLFIDIKEVDQFPMFTNMRNLHLGACFLDECELSDKMETLGSFLQNAPRLETLTLRFCMFYEDSNKEWDINRKSIDLKRHDQKIFHCEKLKAVKVIYNVDHDHWLAELLWLITTSLPDASITLTKT